MLKPFDSEYFRALLILLPGFLSREVAHYFAPFPSKSSDLEILIVCLAFSIVNIMLAIGVWSAGVRMSRRSGDSNEGRQPFGPFIALLLAISLVTGNAMKAGAGAGSTSRSGSTRPSRAAGSARSFPCSERACRRTIKRTARWSCSR